jgi:hypothetical protein
MTSSNTNDSALPIFRSPRSSHRKVRSPSSLAGMFFETESTTTTTTACEQEAAVLSCRRGSSSSPSSPYPFNTEQKVISDNNNNNNNNNSNDDMNKYSPSERQALLEMTRKLRQAKRRLFLKSAVQPVDSVERFREILLRLSFEEPEFVGCGDSQTTRSRSQSTTSSNSMTTQE